MRNIIFLILLININPITAQDAGIVSELKKLSELFATSEELDEGVYIQKVDFNVVSDTLYIYHSKGIPEDYSLDEYHYFMKISQIESVEFKETSMMGITNYLLSFSSKANQNHFIFKYGSKEEIMESLKNETPGEDELQSYITIALPEIKDKSSYKKLESLLKNLIK